MDSNLENGFRNIARINDWTDSYVPDEIINAFDGVYVHTGLDVDNFVKFLDLNSRDTFSKFEYIILDENVGEDKIRTVMSRCDEGGYKWIMISDKDNYNVAHVSATLSRGFRAETLDDVITYSFKNYVFYIPTTAMAQQELAILANGGFTVEGDTLTAVPAPNWSRLISDADTIYRGLKLHDFKD